MSDGYARRIDGRPIGNLTLGEADVLSVRKHAEAQRHMRLAVETKGETSDQHRHLACQAMEDAVLLDKILENAARR